MGKQPAFFKGKTSCCGINFSVNDGTVKLIGWIEGFDPLYNCKKGNGCQQKILKTKNDKKRV